MFTFGAAVLACGPGDGGSETDTTTGSSGEASGTSGTSGTGTTVEPTTEGTVGSSGTGPDPDYVRECQPDDFKCDDWGCERPSVVVLGQCYKRCTPDAIGEADAECDEPERPFCSQVGRALGGDFDCNECAHICVSASFNQCNQSIQSCAG